jgi:hypothetical protein
MKFVITLKDPDGIADSICSAATSSVEHLEYDMLPREYEDLRDSRAEAFFGMISRWSPDTETIRIEIDTDLGTATIVKS